MALEPGSGRRSVSPESSGRESPIPRQWRNQLGEEDYAIKDKSYRKYAQGVDRALVLFETALEEWADYISFLNKLLKALQARPKSINAIPSKATVAKRLSQCLNPSLPSGVHQKALELYNLVFSVIGKDGLSRDLPLYLPGLATVLSFASLSVRAPYLDLLERHFLGIDPRSLRPAMKSIILALLPGLEEETSEDFDRTLRLVESFKHAIRPSNSEEITNQHSSGDAFFWQCFFLASITSQSRRSGALAYLVRSLPPLRPRAAPDPNKSATSQSDSDEDTKSKLAELVTSPEPGLLLRCFASGLSDEQLLIQRGFLDLLVSHLPLNAHVIQSRVKPDDLELLLKAAVGVVTRRDMSLNRRLWAWLLGPEPAAEHEANGDNPSSPPADQHAFLASKTDYFEEFGLQPLTKAILQMIESNSHNTASERAKPYRICLSLMDRWEIGGLVVPEVFLPIIESVRRFKDITSSKTEFSEVLRSASVFFDGIESGLIYGEIASLLAQALGPGALSPPDRNDKLSLVNFILSNFNVREEEMITLHAPLCCLTALAMLQDFKERISAKNHLDPQMLSLSTQALSVATSLLELVPERVFPVISKDSENQSRSLPTNVEILKSSQSFYVNEQGNIEASASPFDALTMGRAILEKAAQFVCQDLESSETDLNACIRLLVLVIHKTPRTYEAKEEELLQLMLELLEHPDIMAFSSFLAILQLLTQLYYAERIETAQLSSLVPLLVRHAWTYLSASEPKYHVEAVRGLWQLQSALSTSNRDIEAALSSLIISQETARLGAIQAVDKGRALSVLWSHTLQDNVSHERRGSKTPTQDMKNLPRLAGADNYEIILTQPVFLILDALQDDRTPLYMTVKAWLNTMLGIDRLFLLFISRLSGVPFLQTLTQNDEKPNQDSLSFSEDEDLDLCLYYLRTLSNILTCAGDISWTVLSSKHVSFHGQHMQISSGGEENEMTLQEFFVRVCMRCITANAPDNATKEFEDRVNQLYRYALSLLHKFLISPFAASLSAQHLENVLIDRLEKSLQGSDGYVQVLLLDVVYDTLKLRDLAPADVPTSPISERRPSSFDPRGSRPSLSVSEARIISPPPPQLLQCLQDGLSSPSSRPVLDSWVAFVSECLPLYSDSIFQVLIPLVETLCREIGITFANLRETFSSNALSPGSEKSSPESTLIFLLNGLEQVLARAHQQLLNEEARTQVVKTPDQPQSLFGSMVSNVWQSDTPQSRSATANDRLTVHLAFQDAVRICFKIWTWGQGNDSSKQDQGSFGSFNYTSLRMRNRARRLLEHLFAAENLQCLETVIALWKQPIDGAESTQVFNMLSALEACRPKHCIPALFNAIYRRTGAGAGAVDTASKSTMTISLQDTDLVWFLVEYTRTLDDDAMDEIWQDCMAFLKDLLTNPFPHRQTLPNLLGFAALLGEKVDNTNFGEQRRMRKELGDTFIRLLAALFTTRPVAFTDSTTSGSGIPKSDSGNSLSGASEGPDDIISILASIVPKLAKVLVEPDRVLSATATISTNVIGPTLRAKGFPDIVSKNTMCLLHELSRVHNNQKNWKKDVGDAFNDSKFFGMDLDLAKEHWLPLLRQWTLTDKEKMPEIVGRINAPSTAGIVFGVGATSARLEADRKTQLNLRRIATLILAGSEDAFVSDLSEIFSRLAELLGASSTSSPSSTTRADIYMVFRALALRTSAIHLGMLWPVVNAEIHAAISSVAAPDNSTASDTYTNASVLQACKLLDLLICVAPDDFQLHEWLFITDTIDAVYRPSTYQPVALVDELSDELGASVSSSGFQSSSVVNPVARGSSRRPLLGPGGINDDVSLDRKDELVAKVLRPFFGQLSIFAFESTYAMGRVDRDACISSLLKDIFDERSIVRAL